MRICGGSSRSSGSHHGRQRSPVSGKRAGGGTCHENKLFSNAEAVWPAFGTGGEIMVDRPSRRKPHYPAACSLLAQRRICSNLDREGSKRVSFSPNLFAILSMNPMNWGFSRCLWEQHSMRTLSL